jgi:hypothetical protein
MKHYSFLFLLLFYGIETFLGGFKFTKPIISVKNSQELEQENTLPKIDTTYKTIHVFVALCDNKYQGIVPVPAKIGNGQDPFNNLYWGCAFGISTYFKKSKEWELLKKSVLDSIRLERLVFKHRTKNFILVADAYDGKYIKKCTQDFLKSSSGLLKETIQIDNKTQGIAGNASLLTYIGHDGLMDFQLEELYENKDKKKRDVIILACFSKKYFSPYIKQAKANPIVWTIGLMAPEAYTVHDAISGYVNKESDESMRTRAAMAYSKYQKCSEKAARNLLVTGF